MNRKLPPTRNTFNILLSRKCIVKYNKMFRKATLSCLPYFRERKCFPLGWQSKWRRNSRRSRVGVILDEKLISFMTKQSPVAFYLNLHVGVENVKRDTRNSLKTSYTNTSHVLMYINIMLLYFHYINWFDACFRASTLMLASCCISTSMD